MSIIIIVLLAIAIPMAILETICIVCMAICSYNIRKHGCWWGNLPNWAADIVDRFN